jgi:hypothetical protein
MDNKEKKLKWNIMNWQYDYTAEQRKQFGIIHYLPSAFQALRNVTRESDNLMCVKTWREIGLQ